MANVDNPHGLRPLSRTLAGGAVRVEEFRKVAGYNKAVFQQDAVNRVADGSIEVSATPGTTLYTGVALNGGPASKATTHLVIVSPDAIYEIQDNNDTDGFAEADMGLNCNLELNNGSAVSGLSGHELDESTAAVTATLDMKLLQRLAVPDNDYGANVRVEVMFNKHRYAPGVAGV